MVRGGLRVRPPLKRSHHNHYTCPADAAAAAAVAAA